MAVTRAQRYSAGTAGGCGFCRVFYLRDNNVAEEMFKLGAELRSIAPGVIPQTLVLSRSVIRQLSACGVCRFIYTEWEGEK
jgi:hypothetical protein